MVHAFVLRRADCSMKCYNYNNVTVIKARIRRSAFSRNPFSRNRNDIETGSHQSGSTTASFIAPVNVGEQFQNVQNELVDVTTKNAGLEFYACFIENGVILLPRTNHQFQRSDLIRKVQEQIAILKPQLQTEQEVGVLVSDGHRKGLVNCHISQTIWPKIFHF